MNHGTRCKRTGSCHCQRDIACVSTCARRERLSRGSSDGWTVLRTRVHRGKSSSHAGYSILSPSRPRRLHRASIGHFLQKPIHALGDEHLLNVAISDPILGRLDVTSTENRSFKVGWYNLFSIIEFNLCLPLVFAVLFACLMVTASLPPISSRTQRKDVHRVAGCISAADTRSITAAWHTPGVPALQHFLAKTQISILPSTIQPCNQCRSRCGLHSIFAPLQMRSP